MTPGGGFRPLKAICKAASRRSAVARSPMAQRLGTARRQPTTIRECSFNSGWPRGTASPHGPCRTKDRRPRQYLAVRLRSAVNPGHLSWGERGRCRWCACIFRSLYLSSQPPSAGLPGDAGRASPIRARLWARHTDRCWWRDSAPARYRWSGRYHEPLSYCSAFLAR